MAATAIATEVVKSIASTIIAGVVQQIKDVVELEENLQLLQTDFTRMEVFLRYIDDRFQEQQRRLPEPVELCLTRMNDALTQAKQLIERAKDSDDGVSVAASSAARSSPQKLEIGRQDLASTFKIFNMTFQ
jgi:hypothetical protein